MRTSLADGQWHAVTEGAITSPDGVTFTRRSSRVKRAAADDLVATGAPLVLYDYGAGRLDWYDGDDPATVWRSIRGAVTSATPRPRHAVVWTAGVWVNENDDPLLVLTGHC